MFRTRSTGRAGVSARLSSRNLLWNARHAGSLTTATTILREKPNQRVHAREIRRVDQLAAGTFLVDQTRSLQVLQVKGEGRRSDPKAFGDDAGGQTVRPCLHQQSIDRQPMFMGEGAKRMNRFRRLHGYGLRASIVADTT